MTVPWITGDTAWVLTSAALVLLMTPGLAFFYGGMVRAKSVLNMMMMSFGALGIVSVLWVLYGYSLAFGDDVGGGLIGDLDVIGLEGLIDRSRSDGGRPAPIPTLAFVGFQLMFAIITVALISGAIADRAKFGAWCVFVGSGSTLVYFPVAHWVFDFDGDTAETAAGSPTTCRRSTSPAAPRSTSTPVPRASRWPSSSASASAGRKEPMRPHNLPFVMLGAGLLWFGWFGFNAGSALGADSTGRAGAASTPRSPPRPRSLGWLRRREDPRRARHQRSAPPPAPSPAWSRSPRPAASVNPLGAIVLGVVAGVLCALAVGLKYKFGFDDSLDVVGVHLVGGLVGSLLIGFFAHRRSAPAGVDGLFYGGGARPAAASRPSRPVAVLALLVRADATSSARSIDKTIGFRINEEDEVDGIDLTSTPRRRTSSAGHRRRLRGTRSAPSTRHVDRRGWTHEARHRGHQAVQARRREDAPWRPSACTA